MEFYCFKVKDVKYEVEKRFKKVSADDDEYISYNHYLESNYGTNISDNEDYIAQLVGDSALIVLKDGYFDLMDLDEVFEILNDKLGERYEESYNCEWVSASW